MIFKKIFEYKKGKSIKITKKKRKTMGHKNNYRKRSSFKKSPLIDTTPNSVISTDTIRSKCPYCNNNEAIIVYYTVTRGDEDTLVLLKCTSCKKTYREGYGY